MRQMFCVGWDDDMGGHLHLSTLLAVIHVSLLLVCFVNRLRVLIPLEVRLGGAKSGCCFVQAGEDSF